MGSGVVESLLTRSRPYGDSSFRSSNDHLACDGLCVRTPVWSARTDGEVHTEERADCHGLGRSSHDPYERGGDYIKAITDSVEQRLLQKLPAGQTWMQHVMIDGKTVERKTAITFQWEGEDLILDN